MQNVIKNWVMIKRGAGASQPDDIGGGARTSEKDDIIFEQPLRLVDIYEGWISSSQLHLIVE